MTLQVGISTAAEPLRGVHYLALLELRQKMTVERREVFVVVVRRVLARENSVLVVLIEVAAAELDCR